MIGSLSVTLLTLAILSMAAATANAQTLTFENERIGALPNGFASLLTGQGQTGRWEIVEDATADRGRALAQLSSDTTDNRFPLAINSAVSAANIEIVVRFKAVAGKVDRAGGVVVRFTDAKNYYVARANGLEDNVRFYRVVGGNRQQLASMDAKVSSGVWHTLSLRAEGDRFTVTFDGNPPLKATDKTFGAAGKSGVWTKSDSVTHYDRIEIKTLP